MTGLPAMHLFYLTLRQALLLNRQCCRQLSTSRTRAREVLPSKGPKPSTKNEHIRQNPVERQSDTPLRTPKLSEEWLNSRKNARELPPSIALKPSFNIKHIWQNPELYSRNCVERNYNSQSDTPFKIAQLHEQWLQSQKIARGLREKSNAIQTRLSHADTFSGLETGSHDLGEEGIERLSEEARKIKRELAPIGEREKYLLEETQRLAAELPNLTSDEKPRGGEVKIIGFINEPLNQPPSSSRDHVHIGTELDLLEFKKAATTSGWGWYFLKNEATLLEDALVGYAKKVAMEHGFAFVTPPSMVYSHIASACGFRPRDQSRQVYNIQQVEEDQGHDNPSLSLAGTAEIPFAGMEANQTLDAADLPVKVVGSSRCYRAEAGARGQAGRGLYRVHEFTKVEMFAWTAPGAEMDVFNSILSVQKTILQKLGLRCRILEMPSHDLGASAYRKQDIEAYFPSRRGRNDGWGEVTSASICTDYQTRRLNTRVKNLAGSEKKTDFPSTVNGTAVAVPRVLAALLENGWDEKGFVRIPEVLWPWMHGVQTIRKKH